MKNIKFLFVLPILLLINPFCCSPKSNEPNIRTMPGIEYCGPACEKMTELYQNGDESCLIYIEDIEVDEKIMNCKSFCEYEMKNSVQLNPKCIYENINTCEEIPEKCED
jgi:hypothetical protein